jgi:hypothetical protein
MKIGNLYAKATPWVSYTVLAGGLLTAIILFITVHTETKFQTWDTVGNSEFAN